VKNEEKRGEHGTLEKSFWKPPVIKIDLKFDEFKD
jgi:hypothetical protein